MSPRTTAAPGTTTGMSAWRHSWRSFSLRASTVAIQRARASFAASEGWKVNGPTSIQFWLPSALRPTKRTRPSSATARNISGPGKAPEPHDVDAGEDKHREDPDRSESTLLEGGGVRRLPRGDGFDAGGGEDHHDPDRRQGQRWTRGSGNRWSRCAICRCLPARTRIRGPRPALSPRACRGASTAPMRMVAVFCPRRSGPRQSCPRRPCHWWPRLAAGRAAVVRVGVLTIVTPRWSEPALPRARGQLR